MTRRTGLWTTLVALIALLLVVLIWLVGRYEQSRLEEDLEQTASQQAADIRSQLGRNGQRLLLLSHRPQTQWWGLAQEVLEENPEILRLELRGEGLQIQSALNSPYVSSHSADGIYQQLTRANFFAEVNQSCSLARAYGEAAYSLSYYVPRANGLGFEVTDYCLPVYKNKVLTGYVVATYALQGMLKEWMPKNQLHAVEITLEEPDGTRLAALGTLNRNGDRLSAQSLLDLHGLTLVLRVSRWFFIPHWMANTPSLLIFLLAAALVVVLWLLQRDMRKRLRTEAEFRQSQERLQRSARLASLGEMASMLSHELNQPLAAIASYATGSLNLMEGEPHALDLFEIKTALERIASQSQRAGVVIKSINDFVRRRDTERKPCAPSALFEGVMPLLSLQARQLGIQLRLHIEDDLPFVWCDKTLIEQVILNLARNGVQSMAMLPADTAHLKQLRLTAQAQDDDHVCFAVEDTGVGLSAEIEAKLFTPFFTTKSEGTGLGLSLCRTVIEQHGSNLTYTSVLSRELDACMITRFSFTLGARQIPTYQPPQPQEIHATPS